MTSDVRHAAKVLMRAGAEEFDGAMFSAMSAMRRATGAQAVYLIAQHGVDIVPQPLQSAIVYAGQHPMPVDEFVFRAARNPLTQLRLVTDDPQLLSTSDARIGDDHVLASARVSHIATVPVHYEDVRYGSFWFLLNAEPHSGELARQELSDACSFIGLSLALRSSRHAYQHLVACFWPWILDTDAAILINPDLTISIAMGAWHEIAARPVSEAPGTDILSHVAQHDVARVATFLTGVDERPRTLHTVKIQRPDRSTIECDIWAHQVDGLGGGRLIAAVIHPTADAPHSQLARHDALDQFTEREREIVERLLTGRRVRHIAEEMFLSEHTVRNNLKRAFRRVGVNSQAELIEFVLDKCKEKPPKHIPSSTNAQKAD